MPYLQICDAASARPAEDDRTAQTEARNARLLVGEGRLPLAALVSVTPAGAALSLEVPDGWSNPDPVGRASVVLRAAAHLAGGHDLR
jgi:hypothetical protein